MSSGKVRQGEPASSQEARSWGSFAYSQPLVSGSRMAREVAAVGVGVQWMLTDLGLGVWWMGRVLETLGSLSRMTYRDLCVLSKMNDMRLIFFPHKMNYWDGCWTLYDNRYVA